MPPNDFILCIPFSSCPQSFPASGSFPMSQLFASGGQTTGASASVLPMNIQGSFFFFYDWLVWYPCCPRGSQESSPRPQFQSINFSAFSFLYDPAVTSVHDYWKIIALTIQTFVGKVMSMLLNMLSRFVIAFLPRSKRLFISWLQSLSTVILEPKKIKSATVSIFSPYIHHEVMGPDTMILVFWMLTFRPAIS